MRARRKLANGACAFAVGQRKGVVWVGREWVLAFEDLPCLRTEALGALVVLDVLYG